MRAVKAILVLVVLAAAGLAGYSYLGDMAPEVRDQSRTLDLKGGDGN